MMLWLNLPQHINVQPYSPRYRTKMFHARVQETLVRNALTLACRGIGESECQQGFVELSPVGAETHQPVNVRIYSPL